MPELGWFALLVAAVAVAGVAIGMLAAPVLTRWTEREDGEDEEGSGGQR